MQVVDALRVTHGAEHPLTAKCAARRDELTGKASALRDAYQQASKANGNGDGAPNAARTAFRKVAVVDEDDDEEEPPLVEGELID